MLTEFLFFVSILIGVIVFFNIGRRIPLLNRVIYSVVAIITAFLIFLFLSALIALVLILILVLILLSFLGKSKFRFKKF